jgi:hypothetical protein
MEKTLWLGTRKGLSAELPPVYCVRFDGESLEVPDSFG